MTTVLKPPAKKPWSIRRLMTVLAVALVCWVALIGLGIHFLFGYHQVKDGAAPIVHNEATDFYAGSLGQERRATLEAATRKYVGTHPDAPAAMREGRELAPADFLNEELAQGHEKFRVRSIKGLTADIYNVT